jgi:SNF2 family DNA or RNA helicase
MAGKQSCVLLVVLQVDLGRIRMNDLMKLCNKFMLRRTSTVLKELLPTKVEQVGPT